MKLHLSPVFFCFPKQLQLISPFSRAVHHLRFGCFLFSVCAFSTIICNQEIQAAQLVDEIRNLVKKNVLWPVSDDTLAGLNGENLAESIKAIDPHARYVPPPASKNKAPRSLGIEIFVSNFKLWIRPDPKGPADRAGMPEIGLLKAVNGLDMTTADLAFASAQIEKALQNKTIELTVATQRGKQGKSYRIYPETHPSRSFTWRRSDNCIAIYIREFKAHDTVPGITALFQAIVTPDMNVILDLRGCSGGDLLEAIESAGLFVPANFLLVETVDRSGKVYAHRSHGGIKLPLPAVVLVDSATASAAEIFAGIFSHYRMARLVGVRTAGKTVSQTVFPLSDGGELWLTTHTLKLPEGKPDLHVGVRPDVFREDLAEATLKDVCGAYQRE